MDETQADPIEAALDAVTELPIGWEPCVGYLLDVALRAIGMRSYEIAATKPRVMRAAIAAYLRAQADAYEAAGEHVSAGIVRGLIHNEESSQ